MVLNVDFVVVALGRAFFVLLLAIELSPGHAFFVLLHIGGLVHSMLDLLN
jgi:hypothetical protein